MDSSTSRSHPAAPTMPALEVLDEQPSLLHRDRRRARSLDAGELAASEAQRAQLTGALDALGQLAQAAPELDDV